MDPNSSFFQDMTKICHLWWELAFELRWCNSDAVPATAGDVTLTRLHSSIFSTTCRVEPVCIWLNFQVTADRGDCKWLLPAQVGLSRPSCWDLSRHWDSYRRDSMRLQLTSHQHWSTYKNIRVPVKKQYSLVSFNSLIKFDSLLMMLGRISLDHSRPLHTGIVCKDGNIYSSFFTAAILAQIVYTIDYTCFGSFSSRFFSHWKAAKLQFTICTLEPVQNEYGIRASSHTQRSGVMALAC